MWPCVFDWSVTRAVVSSAHATERHYWKQKHLKNNAEHNLNTSRLAWMRARLCCHATRAHRVWIIGMRIYREIDGRIQSQSSVRNKNMLWTSTWWGKWMRLSMYCNQNGFWQLQSIQFDRRESQALYESGEKARFSTSTNRRVVCISNFHVHLIIN